MDATNIRNRVDSLRRSFSGSQLVIIGVLVIVAGIGGLSFMRWVSQPSYSVLVSGASPEETKTVIDELDAAGIPYKLTNNGTTVMVKSGDVGDARVDLADSEAGGVVGLELFDKQSFTSSDFQQRIGYQRALQGEITRALLKMDGVTSATVQLAMPTERLFTKDQQAVAASVLIGTSRSLPDSTVQSIVQLVASSVPGLETKNVAVTDTAGNLLSADGASNDDQVAVTNQYELTLASKAETMLSQVYGPGKVVVRVAADLNFDETQKQTTTYTPESATPVQESERNETFSGTGSPPGGTAGVTGAEGASDGTTNEYSLNETERSSVVDSVVETSTQAPGTVERLTAAAIIDESLSPAPDTETVRELVAAAIGADVERGDDVVVQSLPFDAAAQEALDEAASDAGSSSAPSPIVDYARLGGGAVLLLLVAFFLWRGLSNKPDPVFEGNGDLALTAAQPRIGAGGARSVFPDEIDLRQPQALPSELRMIDAAPEELATLLRSWVADRRN
jgi:flagellar M-ring protein FliF